MKKWMLSVMVIVWSFMAMSCMGEKSMEILSPDGELKVVVQCHEDGKLTYIFSAEEKVLIQESSLGFDWTAEDST